MLELGADSFWYWDIGAFVFAGDDTTISVSGTQYKTSDRVILENDIITIEELYYYMNKFIEANGYINLDFMGNLGHSIVKQKSDRIYIEKGNTSKLRDVALFTFEPHISISGSKYGYKRENIYYFEDGKIKEL